MTICGWLGACAAAVVLASPHALPAQQQSPEEVAQAYFAHLRAGELDRVAGLTHPRALESFKAMMLQLIGDEELENTPFAGREDLRAVPADSFFLTFIQGAGSQEEFGAMLGTLEVQPLGHVPQGDSLAHVVYSASMAFMNQQTQQTMVLTLRRHRGGWLVDPGTGLMNMMGGGLMTLMMSAGMQAGMESAMGMDEEHDHDQDMDEDHDHDEDDDEDEDADDDDPPAS